MLYYNVIETRFDGKETELFLSEREIRHFLSINKYQGLVAQFDENLEKGMLLIGERDPYSTDYSKNRLMAVWEYKLYVPESPEGPVTYAIWEGVRDSDFCNIINFLQKPDEEYTSLAGIQDQGLRGDEYNPQEKLDVSGIKYIYQTGSGRMLIYASMHGKLEFTAGKFGSSVLFEDLQCILGIEPVYYSFNKGD